MGLEKIMVTLRDNVLFRNRRVLKYWRSFSRPVNSLQVNSRSISLSRPCWKAVTLDSINTGIKNMEYAVRGPIVTRAAEIEEELKRGVKKKYQKVIRANIGDAHALGQRPITYIRQVLALVTLPELLWGRYPDDVKCRAKCILFACRGGSAGAYTDSPGLQLVREHLAKFMEERDGVPSNYKNILLFDGASNAIKAVLKLFTEEVDGKKSAMMIPIPQYPLYTAALSELHMEHIGYYLDEDKGWSLEVEELERAFKEGSKRFTPRCICVINPGNPTGQVLSKENIESIIKFAHKRNLFIFADEVYFQNVYKGEFHSFKKVMTQMKPPYNEVELASFLSASKGYMGECGLRGGSVELVNVDPQVMALLLKSVSAMLCPNVIGQALMDCVYTPPKPGEPSYELFVKERDETMKHFKTRANMVTEAFNSYPNMSCNEVQGALYAFPKIEMPEKAIAKAKSKNMCPSAMYCFELLEETGVCIVSGAGFKQVPGTYHFRTSILPQHKDLKVMLDKFRKFQIGFLKRYS